MYILIRQNLPEGFSHVGAANAAMGAYQKFQEHKDTKEWADDKWYKVVCKVTDKEFEAAKRLEDHILIKEDTLDDMEISLGFRRRRDWPTFFGFFRLYK